MPSDAAASNPADMGQATSRPGQRFVEINGQTRAPMPVAGEVDLRSSFTEFPGCELFLDESGPRPVDGGTFRRYPAQRCLALQRRALHSEE